MDVAFRIRTKGPDATVRLRHHTRVTHDPPKRTRPETHVVHVTVVPLTTSHAVQELGQLKPERKQIPRNEIKGLQRWDYTVHESGQFVPGKSHRLPNARSICVPTLFARRSLFKVHQSILHLTVRCVLVTKPRTLACLLTTVYWNGVETRTISHAIRSHGHKGGKMCN